MNNLDRLKTITKKFSDSVSLSDEDLSELGKKLNEKGVTEFGKNAIKYMYEKDFKSLTKSELDNLGANPYKGDTSGGVISKNAWDLIRNKLK